MQQQLARAASFRSATAKHFPWIVEELDAVAAAAGVDPLVLFAVSIEEIWPDRDTTARIPDSAVHGCTDIVASGLATRDGRTLVAHNNDLAARTQTDIRAVEWRVDGSPAVFSLGIGPWLSVSWNAAGLGVTGNELAPNDDKTGVPRLLLMTAASRCTSIAEAKAVVGHHARASSYNWVLTHEDGTVVSVEGSATNSVELQPDRHGLLHHENHYTHPAMRPYERDATHAARSGSRGQRVAMLLSDLAPASADITTLRAILSDHTGAPDSVCRHAESPDEMQTVFWAIADMRSLDLEYGIGPPCTSRAKRFSFAPQAGALAGGS